MAAAKASKKFLDLYGTQELNPDRLGDKLATYPLTMATTDSYYRFEFWMLDMNVYSS